MRTRLGRGPLLAVCLVLTLPLLHARRAEAARSDATALLSEIVASVPGDPSSIRRSFTPDGHLRSLGMPPGALHGSAAPVDARDAALSFLQEHAGAFGMTSSRVGFDTMRQEVEGDRHYVRLRQTVDQIPVFGGEIVVQTNARFEIVWVFTDVLRNGVELSTQAALQSSEAELRAMDYCEDALGVTPASASTPELVVYAPEVIGEAGDARLAWFTQVVDAGERPRLAVLVDAHLGDILFSYSLMHSALDREVFDAADSDADPGTLERSEGDAASTIADVNLAYEYLGDTYDFYWTRHQRDGIDGTGATLSATVRFCSNEPGMPCPMPNAFWSSNGRMYFGSGYAVDDVTAHELTHGVTSSESQLVYANESGAINESLSDIWGEFVDLTNGAGSDTAADRWLLAEDLPGNPIRDMQDPTTYGDPDRMGSPLFVPSVADPDRENDYGGVHANSGVGNKLCYLLTDGDSFNGWTVYGLGLDAVAALFYEAQTNLLTSASDYADLYVQLTQAAVNLNWSAADRENLERACLAVEIRPPYEEVSGTIAVDTTWDSELPYYVTGDLSIAAGATLTIVPGTLVKVLAHWQPHEDGYLGKRRIFVYGTLLAEGTAADPIVFTSDRHDAIGGDLNGDGNDTYPGPGDWGYIRLSGTGSRMSHCQILYNGLSDDNTSPWYEDWRNYQLWIEQSDAFVSQCTFDGGYRYGIFGSSGNRVILLGNTLDMGSQPNSEAIHLGGGDSPFVMNSTVRNTTDYGIYCSIGTPNITDNDVTNAGTYGIHLATNEGNLLRNTITGATYGLYLASGQAVVQDNTVSQVTYGLWSNGGDPDFTGNSIDQADVPLVLYNDAWVDVPANNYSNLTYPAIRFGGTMTQSRHWGLLQGGAWTYLVWDDLTVASGATLTIDPGVLVKVHAHWQPHEDGYLGKRRIFVNGTLLAEGTPTDPIVFTSDRHDDLGGDLNGDGSDTYPARGDWGYIRLSGTGSRMSHCQILYNGLSDDNTSPWYEDWRNYQLWVEQSDASVSQCIFDEGYQYGIVATAGNHVAVFENTVDLHDQANSGGISFTGGNSPSIQSNVVSNTTYYGIECSINGSTIADNVLTSAGTYGIRLATNGGNLLRNTITGATYGLHLASGQAVVQDNTISQVTYGLWSDGGDPDFTGNSIDLATYPLGLYNDARVIPSANTFTNLTYEAIVCGGTIGTDRRWIAVAGGAWTYLVRNDLTVASGATLTIDPGVLVKVHAYWQPHEDGYLGKRRIFVNGTLLAEGTLTDPIVFTSDRHDDLGGDLNGDGSDTYPARGDWGYIRLSGTGSRMSHCQILYNGLSDDNTSPWYEDWRNYQLWVERSDILVEHTLFEYGYETAIRATTSAPDIQYCHIDAPATGISLTHEPNGLHAHVIQHNTIVAGTNQGIYYDGNAAYSQPRIVGNTVDGQGAAVGIELHDVEASSVVADNVVQDTSTAILLRNAPAVVHLNILGQAGATLNTGIGVDVGPSVDTSITGNTIAGFDTGLLALATPGSTPQILDVHGNHFVDNGSYAVHLASTDAAQVDGPVADVHDNDLLGSGLFELYLGPYQSPGTRVISAENNWWGSTDVGVIAATIHDTDDDPASPTADFDPWRSGPIDTSTPGIWGSLTDVETELIPGGSSLHTIVLGNNGTTSLNFALASGTTLPKSLDDLEPGKSYVPWMGFTPSTGVIPTGGSVNVSLTLSAGTLADDVYRAFLVVFSSDPAADLVVIPVTMHVSQVLLVQAPENVAVEAGNPVTLDWVTYDPARVTRIDLRYSTDGGQTFPFAIATGLPDVPPYEWIVPQTPAEECIVQIFAFYDDFSVLQDTSDAPFRILARFTDVQDELPTVVTRRLEQNQPNPFNPSTTISYTLTRAEPVRLQIFDLSGRLVRTLVDEWTVEGTHAVIWHGLDASGRQAASGIYLYRIQTPSFVETRSMVLLK